VPKVPSRSAFAIRFFVASLAVLASALLVGALLIAAMPPAVFPSVRFPPAFAASTVAVLLGSLFLNRALGCVRRERQPEFRRQLVLALAAGALFVAIQMSALNWLVQRQAPQEVPTGETAFVTVMAALHALHFIVALLFLVFVTVQAHAHRYDHEYYWGVLVCSWFWHALTVLWLAVLGVVAIASS